MINPLHHFGIKTRFIRGDTKSYNYDSPICPHCGKHYPKTGEHECEEVLKIWRPGSREFIGDKELK